MSFILSEILSPKMKEVVFKTETFENISSAKDCTQGALASKEWDNFDFDRYLDTTETCYKAEMLGSVLQYFFNFLIWNQSQGPISAPEHRPRS